jgi:UDP-GlcNAc:undecaprenyl-phosphate/decaprenyl-phosphate GlcNAc-1-phosphate transferase
MGIHYVSLFIASSLASLCLAFILFRASLRARVLQSRSGIPLVGGIAVWIVYSLFCQYLAGSRLVDAPQSLAIVLSGCIVVAGGIWDDIRELSVAAKLILQVCAVSVLVSLGIRTHIFFLNTWANIAVTYLWVLAVTNAFNLLDIMDGLCATITLVVAFGLFIICVFNRDIQSTRLLIVVIGATAGFLVLNAPAAKLYLGNAGSHYLGFVLAAVSIQISYASASRQAALISPVFIMGFPLFDMIFVALVRLRKGRSALAKSRDHLALRFLKLGHSPVNALLIMFSGAVLFTACGVLMSQVSHTTGIVFAAAVLLIGSAAAVAMARVSLDE